MPKVKSVGSKTYKNGTKVTTTVITGCGDQCKNCANSSGEPCFQELMDIVNAATDTTEAVMDFVTKRMEHNPPACAHFKDKNGANLTGNCHE